MQKNRTGIGRRALDFFGIQPKPTKDLIDIGDGHAVLHLNNMINNDQFQTHTVLELMDMCYWQGTWFLPLATLVTLKKDVEERLLNLICDIGGLTEFEIDMQLGQKEEPASYVLSYRRKGDTGNMKYTQPFPSKIAPQGTEDMDTKKSNTMIVILNEYRMGSGICGQTFQDRLTNSDFFVDTLDALAACRAVSPIMPLLSDLTEHFTVTLKFYSQPEPGHPGWEFSCVPRVIPTVTGRFDSTFRHQPDMGMGMNDMSWGGSLFGNHSSNRNFMMMGGRDIFGNPIPSLNAAMDPDSQFGNDVVCELLNLYSLTQIKPLPSQARGRNFPAGLELLELVKRRLGYPHLGMPQTMMPTNMFNGNINPMASAFGNANFMDPRGPGYAGEMYNGPANRHPGYVARSRYTRVNSTIPNPSGYDLTPPEMQEGDKLHSTVIDTVGSRVVHLATNYTTAGFGVYDCTRTGNLLKRSFYPAGLEWTEHEGLMQELAITKLPLATFKFPVSDELSETIATITAGLNKLNLPIPVYEVILSQVKDVLVSKPISSSEHVELNFTLGIVGMLPPALEMAIGEPRHGAWVIHTDVTDPEMMPDRFWVLQADTRRTNMF